MPAPSTTLTTRPATGADVLAVRWVLATAYDQYAAVLAPAVFAAYLEDLLDVTGRMAAGDVLVATDGDEVLGTVTWYADGAGLGMGWPAGWSALRALAVVPSRRSRGAGRALVEACVERAVAAGAPTLGLHTAAFMTAAVDLYERCGFRRQPELDVTPAALLDVAGDDLPPVIAYRRDLG